MSPARRHVTITVWLPDGDGDAFVALVGAEGFHRMRREYARLRARRVELGGAAPRGVPLDLWQAYCALEEVIDHYRVGEGSDAP